MEVQDAIRIEVWASDTTSANTWIQMAHHMGIFSLTGCHCARIFFISGELSAGDIRRLASELLADPVTEKFAITTANLQADHSIEVTLLPGVTDPVAENLQRAAHLLGMNGVRQVSTGERYLLDGPISPDELHTLAVSVFSNPVIQRFEIDHPITPPFVPYTQTDSTVDVIELREAGPDTLLTISTARGLSLDLAEMQAIQDYFRQEGRDPTDVELEMLAQTWSEHCVHKTFKARIDYTGPLPGTNGDPVRQEIDGLLDTYIRGATDRLMKPWIHSAFKDNAGIITFDDHWDLAFKLETHNHPSAIEPFGGANTGVGGVVRDILGVSARPIANTDILCFGPLDLPLDDLPAGTLHPRRVQDGVVRGVEDYGNKMGIPTVNGAILYHPGYTANPLVFCGCLGILPHGSHPTEQQPGDLIVVMGGRTGRDGLHGATFSSREMDQTTGQTSGSAVQIGHPINEKQVQEVILLARDERLYSAITDCGAGGLSSAVGEMGGQIGARIQLDRVPLKYPGLRPWEIWLSEAQERMVLAVPPDNWTRLLELCAGQDVEAVCLGELESSGRFQLYYGDQLVADLRADFLHNGIPRRNLTAHWEPTVTPFEDVEPADLSAVLLDLLAHPNIHSKENVVRRYDHEVQGGAAVKPLVGEHGPGDAAVLVPLDVQFTARKTNPQGLALSAGIGPQYTDPYAMAWAAVDEAMRNLVAVGANPDQVALLDNFCWGNPNLPDRLGSLVRCVQGCYDAAMAYQAPFISGKDSLNNEYADQQGQRHTIPGTLLISALGIVPDVSKTVTMDLKHAGNRLYIIGETSDEMGGSHYALVRGLSGGTVPQPIPDALESLRGLYRLIQAGLVQSCHDCSEGGLGVTIAEMCIAGRLGATIDLDCMPAAVKRDETLLFSESLARLIVEIRPEDAAQFESILAGIPHAPIGAVTEMDLLIHGGQGSVVVALSLTDLERAWRGYVPPHESLPQPRKIERRAALPKSSPLVLILHANGTNRDREAALACEVVGARPEIVHINQLLSGDKRLLDYHMLVLPGGFSYGDDLGAGTLAAMDLRWRLGEDVRRFIDSGRPTLGICNGFQTLVKLGVLPGAPFSTNGSRSVTLTHNDSGKFECRWVYLQPNSKSPSLFTQGLDDLIACPVAHGEGRIAVQDEATLKALREQGLIALTYVNPDGSTASYPANPNGSPLGIAGLCNTQGNVLGLMPHPEDHLFFWQHPRWHRGERGLLGLHLFENGVLHV